MLDIQIFTPIVASLFAALFSIVAGVISTVIGVRFSRGKKTEEKELEGVVASVRSERRLLTAELIEKKLESELSSPAPDTKSIVEALKRFAVEISEVERNSPAVENLVSGYHEKALSQARAQFWFSVAAATAGFVWILYAGMDIRADNLATAFKTLPGVVMDAVAFLFFKQASETRQRATDLYDRLRKDKQTTESISLVASIEDTRVRSAVKAQMALHMAGLDPSPINLTNFLSSAELEQAQPMAQHEHASPSSITKKS